MGLKEDLDIYLKMQERQKTSFGGIQESDMYPAFEEFEAQPPQSTRNSIIDAVGMGAWTAFDELLFGLPGIGVEKAFGEEVVEDYLTPKTFAGKAAAGVGGLVGFVKGPMAAGNVLIKGGLKAKGALKGTKTINAALKSANKKIGGHISDDLVETGVELQVANRLRGLANSAKHNADIAFDKGFRVAAFRNIDDGVENLLKAGTINADEAMKISKIYKKQFMNRPVDDLIDVVTKRIPGRKGYILGRTIHEATLFGAIDAVHEGFSAYGRGHEYDWTAPLWGIGTGGAFGQLARFKPRGKGSGTQADFVQGLRGIFRRPIQGDRKELVIRGKMMGENLQREGRHIWTYKDKDIDLTMLESHISTMGKAEAETFLKGLLTDIRNKEGKSIIKWAVKNDWQSSKENWRRMLAGTVIMNARLLKEWHWDGHRPADDDLFLNVLIGAFINRKGAPRRYDMFGKEMSTLRSNLAILNVKTKNHYENIPTLDIVREAHINPLNNDPKLREVVKEAEKLGMADNEFASVDLELKGKVSAKVSTEDLQMFKVFHKYLSSAGNKKYVKPLDAISEIDALQIQGRLQKLVGKDGNFETLRRYMRDNVKMSEQRLEQDVAMTAYEIGTLFNLPGLRSPSSEFIGPLPRYFRVNQALKNAAKDGKLKFLKDEKGESLSGTEAVEALMTIAKKGENLFELTRSSILRAGKSPDKENTINLTADAVEGMQRILNSREAGINSQLGDIKDLYKFSFLDTETIGTQLQRRKFDRALKKINKLLDRDNEVFEREIYPELSADGGLSILRPDLEAIGGARLIDTAHKLRITGGNPADNARFRKAREFLNTIVELIGSKGTYEIDPSIKTKEVNIHTIENFRDKMNELGMSTDIATLRLFSRELSLRNIRQQLADSKLSDNDTMMMYNLLASPEKLVKYRVIGEGRPVGFSIQKIEPISKDPTLNDAIREYNAFVDKVRELGEIDGGRQNFVSVEKKRIAMDATNADFANFWQLVKYDTTREGGKSAREQLNDLVSLIEGPNRLRDAITIASTSNPDKVYEMLQMLQAEGIIERKVKKDAKTGMIESLTLNFTADSKTKFYNKEVQERIYEALKKYGINKENIDQVYDMMEKSQDIMIDEKFGAGDSKIRSEDSFFKKYFKTESIDNITNLDVANKESKDLFLENIVYKKNNKLQLEFRGNQAVDLLMEKMKFKDSERGSAYDDAVHIIANRLTQKTNDLLYYSDGSIKTKNVKTTHRDNKLTELLENELGLRYVYLDGMATAWEQNDRGQLHHRSYNIFQKDADMLPGPVKKGYKAAYDEFRLLLNNYKTDEMGLAGMEIHQIPGSNYTLGIPREYHGKIKVAYNNLFNKYESQLTGIAERKMKKTKELLENSSDWTPAHSMALDALMFEKMLHGSQANRFLDYVGLEPGHKDIIDLSSRMKLFFTPNFNPVKETLIDAISKSSHQKAPLMKKYLRKKGFNMVSWNDKTHGDIRDRVNNLLPKGQTWETLLGNRASESGFDSITFISRDMADFLAAYTGNMVENARIFKPVINSNEGATWFFGKTVFVHDPYMQTTFFNKHKGVDLMTTSTSDKLKTMRGNYFEKSINDMPNSTRREVSDATFKLPLNSIGIKDVPSKKSPARTSQSLFQNYIDSGIGTAELYKSYFGERLDKGMKLIEKTVSNPLFETIMIRRIKGLGNKFQEMEMKSEAAQHQGLFIDYINHSKYATVGPFGKNMLMNMLQAEVITPSLAPYSYFEYGGNRYNYGAKSVMVQSLNPAYRDLAPTVVTKEGKLEQYGEMMLPDHVRFEPIEIPGKDLEVQVVKGKNESVNAKEWYIDYVTKKAPKAERLSEELAAESWKYMRDSEQPLGFLHDFVSQSTKGDVQLAVTTSRFPRTRPNDLAILRLRGFLDKQFGNATIINDFDVLNIFEGDYDYDKADYFWMNSPRVYKHIKESKRHWVHTVDVESIKPATPPVELLGMNPSANRDSWSRLASNNLVMGDFARGMAQGTIAQVNHVRNLAAKDKNGEHVLLEARNGEKLLVDWDNQEWFMRHAFESQHILDHKMGVDPSIMNNLYGYRGEYLFPTMGNSFAKEDFRGANGEWDANTLRDFIGKKSRGEIHKRIRLFRKYNKEGKEIELSEMDKDIIRTIMGDYNQMLNLTPGRQTNSSEGRRRVKYEDYINNGNEYFNNYANFSDYVFSKLRNMRKFNPDGSYGGYKYSREDAGGLAEYFDMKTVRYKSSIDREKYYNKKRKDTDPPYQVGEGEQYRWFTGEIDGSPFTKGTIENARKRYEGTEGSLIERTVNNIWRENPLQAGDKIVMTGERFALFENLERQLLGNDRFKLEEIGSLIPSMIHNVNRAKGEILRLKYTAARTATNTRIRKDRKELILQELNDKIAVYEKQLEPLLTKEYKKYKRAKDIGKINLVQIAHNTDIIEATVQHYTLENLGNIVGGAKGEAYWKSIAEVRQRVGKEYAEYNDFASFSEIKQGGFNEKTIMNAGKVSERINRKDRGEIEQLVENLITQNVAQFGQRWLYDFAAPAKNPEGTIGIFGGRVQPVALKKSGNYKRALLWLLKAHKGLIEGRNTYEDRFEAGQILTNWQKLHYIWTNRFHGNARDIPMNDIKWFHSLRNADGKGFSTVPEMPGSITSMYDNYRNFRFDRKIDHTSPYALGNDNTMNFFRTLFEIRGDKEGFENYYKELSYIDQMSIENGFMHPIKYSALMKNLESSISEVANEVFKGSYDVSTGKVDPVLMNRLRENPVYWMMGGSRYQGNEGITLNPSKAMSSYNREAIQRVIQHSDRIVTTPHEGNKFVDFFGNNKVEGVKC